MRAVAAACIALLALPSPGRAQQQACTPDESARIDALMQRSQAATMRFLETRDFSWIQRITQESQQVNASLGPSCYAFLQRLSAMQAQQPRPGPSPRIGGGGVTYDRATDTYIGGGVSCGPRGCMGR